VQPQPRLTYVRCEETQAGVGQHGNAEVMRLHVTGHFRGNQVNVPHVEQNSGLNGHHDGHVAERDVHRVDKCFKAAAKADRPLDASHRAQEMAWPERPLLLPTYRLVPRAV
jgi:hypothetical protein